MDGKVLIESIHLRNFLSFGPDSEPIDLLPLNVLIGPNGSGKTNLIEALAVLQAAPRDLAVPFRRGGGVGEWLWKGEGEGGLAEIEVSVACAPGGSTRHRLTVGANGGYVAVEEEWIAADNGDEVRRVGQAIQEARHVHSEDQPPEARQPEMRLDEKLAPASSILTSRSALARGPEVLALGEAYSSIAIYRDWTFGPDCAVRRAQPADLPGNALLPDCSNLALVLSGWSGSLPGTLRHALHNHLEQLMPTAMQITTPVHGGVIQLVLTEDGLSRPTPASRLSDGTLRYLCLLAILLNPEPPGLVCIEEPELGLHPDIIPGLADLLRCASQRMQLVVTTHSDMLVSALSDVPEAIVVCERDDAGTHLRRLDPEPLKEWIDEYRLGEAWLSGHLGGTRF